MNPLLDLLEVLNYGVFLKERNLQPLHKYYFTFQAPNPNEQFFYFASLATWLLKLRSCHIDYPEQFDDPNATTAAIVIQLRNLNLKCDISTARLRPGFGLCVIDVLHALALLALEGKPKLKNPVFIDDQIIEEAIADDDAEIIAETYDQVSDDEYENIISSPTTKVEKKQLSVAEQEIILFDMAEWKHEIERVTPLLKIHIANDNKDWRLHLSQLQKHLYETQSSFTDSKTQMKLMHDNISKNSEKLYSREKYISTHFEQQELEHRGLLEELNAKKKELNEANDIVTELTLQLNDISEVLESQKATIDEIGSSMTDAKPLVNIKLAVTRLKIEIKQMNLRIGVLDHALLSGKINHKRLDFDKHINESHLQISY